ncbi:MAG TPA: hypothetical protein VF120_13555, partial [Ktedonobacterales bacterium]
QGHLICPACRRHDDADPHSGCPICAGVSAANPSSAALSEAGVLTLAHIDAMSAATWHLFIAWLLEQDGYRIERGATLDSLDYWLCRSVSGDETLLAGAIRFADRRCLAREDVERLVAQRSGKPIGPFLLISTAPAAESASEASSRLGVRLLDRAALAERLDGLVARQLHEREAADRNQQARAETAAITRAALLSELQRAEEALASAANTRRAAGRSVVASAASTLMDALMPTQRALLAWETLIHDWTAAFDEREARDGSLSIRADEAAFAEVAGRARHLGAALAEAVERVAESPGVGDLGYTVWRRDILEQLSAQCEACRWRVLGIDPSQWREFTAAYDAPAFERADGAAATALHAATRASRSYAELARRARLEESTA